MMQVYTRFLSLALAMSAISAAAQVTGSGSSGNVPQFTGTSSIGDSPIAVSGSNVGIGTTSPASKLDVEGGSITVGGGSVSVNGLPTLSTTGAFSGGSIDGHWMGIYPSLGGSNWNSIVQAGDQAFIYSGAGIGTGAFVLASWANGYSGLRIDSSGNVGIGTPFPGAKLEVSGSIKLSANSANSGNSDNSGASVTYADGTVQSTAWTGVLSGGDYAESVNISGNREAYEPGDVLVIDPSAAGRFLKSSTPYATTVTGIYSTKPGVVGRRQHTAQEHMKEEVPMAMTGIVPTKVSAENGPIKPGDLLVTSSKAGYAMKGTDRSQMLGAVIGKAIGYLDSGIGVIEAVVTLQ